MIFVLAWAFAAWEGPWSISVETLSEPVSAVQSAIVTEDEEVYLLAASERRIFRLDANGRELSAFGGKGQGPGEMFGPMQLHYDPQKRLIMAADGGKRKLVCFHRDGRFSHEIPWPGLSLMGLFLSDDLAAYAEAPFRPERPGLGADIFLQSPDEGDPKPLLHLGPELHEDPQPIPGANHSKRFPWSKKALLARSPNGKWLIVGATAELSFQVVEIASRRIVGRIADRAPQPPLSTEEVDANLANMREFGRVYSHRDFDNPEYKPPVAAIHADALNRLWVRLQTPWRADQAEWRVYTRDGALAGTLALPATFRFAAADAAWLWGRLTDPETEEQRIQKRPYRLTPRE